MALENVQTSITYQGTGTEKVFSVPFPVLDKTHLEVHAVAAGTDEATPLAPGVDYQASLDGGAGTGATTATVTLAEALAPGGRLVVARTVPLTQENMFHNQGPNYARVIEDSLDKLTMIAQQLSERQSAGGTGASELRAEVGKLERSDAQLRLGMADLNQSKADRGDLQAVAGTLKSRDDELQTQISGLAQGKAESRHSPQHSRFGDDPLTPASIGAMPDSHAAESDPHPQYALRDGDWRAHSFFEYVLSDGMTLKPSVPGEATSSYFIAGDEGIYLRGAV